MQRGLIYPALSPAFCSLVDLPSSFVFSDTWTITMVENAYPDHCQAKM